MMPSQILLTAVVLFILFKTLQAYFSRKITKWFMFVWVSFWFVVLVLLLHPYFLIRIAALLRIGRGVDVAIYGAIIIIFYILFKLFVKLREIERKIAELVRAGALYKLYEKK